jgi:hypothetical protein
MEEPLNEGSDNNLYKSSSITVFAVIEKDTIVVTFQVNGFLTVVSFGNKI